MKKIFLSILLLIIALPFVYSQNVETEQTELINRLEEINTAIENNPNEDEFYFLRGEIYRKLKMYNNAIMDYTKTIELNPDYLIAYVGRCLVYIFHGIPDEAINDINHVIEIGPSYFSMDKLYAFRSSAYIVKNDYIKALSDINWAISNNPSEYGYLIVRAEIYEKMAKRSLRRSVKREYLNRAKRDYEAVEKIKNVGVK